MTLSVHLRLQHCGRRDAEERVRLRQLGLVDRALLLSASYSTLVAAAAVLLHTYLLSI